MQRKINILIFACGVTAWAQANPPAPQPPAGATLTLHGAEALALQNHPQVLAAQNETFVQNQRIIQAQVGLLTRPSMGS